jgi:hypothetical protein
MTIEQQIDELQDMVSQYDLESFAGFFSYFIRDSNARARNTSLSLFDSKARDFLYLIGLNAFSEHKGSRKIDYKSKDISIFAQKLGRIKSQGRLASTSNYNESSVIQELASRNHFDNTKLSYVEQDLEKILTIFEPFDQAIIQDFGIGVQAMVNIYKYTEQLSMGKLRASLAFSHTAEYAQMLSNYGNTLDESAAAALLSEEVADQLLAFEKMPHRYLLFEPSDLYSNFPKNSVDTFLDLFSCRPMAQPRFRYYLAESPFESKPILQIGEHIYLQVYQKQIAGAIYKLLYNHLSANAKLSSRLHRHKDRSLEKKVCQIFRSFFPPKQTFFYENYHVGTGGEQDLLIFFKGSAIIVEIKATRLREPFRDIDRAVERLQSDFANSIQYGYEQCKRMEDHMLGDQGFEIKDQNGKVLYKVRPSKIRQVYSIVVTLERFGSLQTDLSLMLNKDNEAPYPWSVYIDDLETFLLAMKQTTSAGVAGFLNFLELRNLIHGRLHAIDELDVCAYYMQDPSKFKTLARATDQLLHFSPYEQDIFDKLYRSKKLRFQEKGLPWQ